MANFKTYLLLARTFFTKALFVDPRACAHRRATVQVPDLPQGLRGPEQLQLPQEDLSPATAAERSNRGVMPGPDPEYTLVQTLCALYTHLALTLCTLYQSKPCVYLSSPNLVKTGYLTWSKPFLYLILD